jgi:hypothetical protein
VSLRRLSGPCPFSLEGPGRQHNRPAPVAPPLRTLSRRRSGLLRFFAVFLVKRSAISSPIWRRVLARPGPPTSVALVSGWSFSYSFLRLPMCIVRSAGESLARIRYSELSFKLYGVIGSVGHAVRSAIRAKPNEVDTMGENEPYVLSAVVPQRAH